MVAAGIAAQIVAARVGRKSLRLRTASGPYPYLGFDATVSATAGYAPQFINEAGPNGGIEYELDTDSAVWAWTSTPQDVVVQFLEIY